MTPERVAGQVIEAIRRDRVVTFVPRWQGAVAWVLGAVPFITEPLWGRLVRKRIAALYDEIERERPATIAARPESQS